MLYVVLIHLLFELRVVCGVFCYLLLMIELLETHSKTVVAYAPRFLLARVTTKLLAVLSKIYCLFYLLQQSLTQYGMVNHAGSAAAANHSPSSSPLRASPNYSTPMEGCASAHVLYTVARDHSVSSPGSASDMSPGSVPIQFNLANTMSPQWFSHSQSPPSPSSRQRDGSAASGELSPAHASALQQRFQQINMVRPDFGVFLVLCGITMSLNLMTVLCI